MYKHEVCGKECRNAYDVRTREPHCRACKKIIAQREESNKRAKVEDEDEPHDDSLTTWDINVPCKAWTARRVQDYVVDYPSRAPLLTQIHPELQRTSVGNFFMMCTFEHPTNFESVTLRMNATAMRQVPQYEERVKNAIDAYKSRGCSHR
jgi:hypothetical protein